MRNNYIKYKQCLFVVFALLLSTLKIHAQFTQRTSAHAMQHASEYIKKDSEGKIYNLRGDFVMAGNANLVAASYSNTGSNNGNMVFVDVDNDASTVNSSAAFINIPNDNCTEVVYAGLYWTGINNRSGDYTQPGKSIANAPGTTSNSISHDHTFYNTANNLDNTYVNFYKEDGTNFVRQVVTIGNRVVEFKVNPLTNEINVRSTNATTGAWSTWSAINATVAGTISTPTTFTEYGEWINTSNTSRERIVREGTKVSGTKVYTLPTAFNISYNNKTYSISKLSLYYETRNQRVGMETSTRTCFIMCGNWSSQGVSNYSNYVDIPYSTEIARSEPNNYVTITGPRTPITTTTPNNDSDFTLNRTKVKFKKEGGTYQEYTANASSIRFPNSGVDRDIFVGYHDVTEYVKANKGGKYYLANLGATIGTMSTGTGYFGGWSLVVVYANPELKWRDITVFDGYAYVEGGSNTPAQNLNISGFEAAQAGEVNIDMGIMAGEGDVSISGDYFRIKRRANSTYANLGNTGNVIETGGFFNSNVNTSGRIPSNKNNYGVDVQRLRLPNQEGGTNVLIGNGDTSTTFQYGSDQDAYTIFNMVFAVDAYIPQAEGVSKVVTNLTPAQLQSLEPGDEVTFSLDIYNYGSDPIDQAKIELEVPRTMLLQSATMVQNTRAASGATEDYDFDDPVWISPLIDPSTNPTGVIIDSSTNNQVVEGGLIRWNLTTIPTQTDPLPGAALVPMATMTYTFKVTESCLILRTSNDDCVLKYDLDGEITGIGRNSRQNFNGNFITGFNEDCDNSPIYDQIKLEVTPSEDFYNNCADILIVDNNVLLEYTCGSSSTIDYNGGFVNKDKILKIQNANGSSSSVNRYPIGTRFFSVVPTQPNFKTSEIFIAGWQTTWMQGETPIANPNYQNNFPVSFETESSGDPEIEQRVGYIYVLLPGTTNLSCYYKIKIVYKTASVPVMPDYTAPVCLSENSDFLDVFTENMVFFRNVNNAKGNEITRAQLLAELGTTGIHSYFVGRTAVITEQDFENPILVNYDLGNVNLPVTCTSQLVPVTMTIQGGPALQAVENLNLCSNRNFTTTFNFGNPTSIIYQYNLNGSWINITNQVNGQIPGLTIENNQLKIVNANDYLNNNSLKFRIVVYQNGTSCASISNDFRINVRKCSMMVNPSNANPFRKP